MFALAVEHECKWTGHIVGDDILGITANSTEQYTKYLANARLKAIGLDPLWTEAIYKKSPYAHLERFSDTKKKLTRRQTSLRRVSPVMLCLLVLKVGMISKKGSSNPNVPDRREMIFNEGVGYFQYPPYSPLPTPYSLFW